MISHLVGAWIYTGAREQAVRAIGGYAATQRVANLARLVDEAPADWRARIVAALERSDLPRRAVGAAAGRLPPSDADGAAQAIEDYLRRAIARTRPGRASAAPRSLPIRPPGAPFGPPFDRRPFPVRWADRAAWA